MIRRIAPVAVAVALCALAACSGGKTPAAPSGSAKEVTSAATQTSASRTATVQATATAAGTAGASPTDLCGATQLRGWVSAQPSDDVKAQIANTIGQRTIRYYTEGDPITADFRPDRINAVLGKSGRIAEFRCG